jgi:hypothetical protein
MQFFKWIPFAEKPETSYFSYKIFKFLKIGLSTTKNGVAVCVVSKSLFVMEKQKTFFHFYYVI